ncbi:MAG TPA: glycosyltransferase family 2 protein [Thermomicrobiaceae bacterium]|nr:glycosyltransferase family 2 protein [Thermomicrobiaceae bacterium]
MKRVSVVVVNHNTADLLGECLRRLTASRLDRPLEVFVVDNGSTDGSVALIEREFPGVRLIEAPSNLGFARGNNLALREILSRVGWETDRHEEYVLLLNTDCLVEPDTLQLTAGFLDEHPLVGVVGPRVLLPSGRLDLACRRSFPTPANAFWKLTGLSRAFPHHPRLARYNLTYLDPDATYPVDSVMGAYMLVRLAAIDDAGLLDESFFMYGEDLDWAYRIKKCGWSVFYYPVARVLHYKGASSSRQSYRLIVEFYRAMYLFHRKHYAPRTFVLVNWLVAAGIVARGGYALARNVLRPAGAKRVA